MEKDFLLCPKKKSENFLCFFLKNQKHQKKSEKIFSDTHFFLHGYSIFFIDIFFKIYLLYQSYPTHLLSTPESELGASGNENSV